MFPGVFNIVGTPFDNVSTLHVLVFGLKIGLVADSGMLVSFAVETTVRCPAITEDTGFRRHMSFYYGYWCGSIPIINRIQNNTVSFSGNNAKNPHLDTYIVISLHLRPNELSSISTSPWNIIFGMTVCMYSLKISL